MLYGEGNGLLVLYFLYSRTLQCIMLSSHFILSSLWILNSHLLGKLCFCIKKREDIPRRIIVSSRLFWSYWTRGLIWHRSIP